MPLYMGLDVGGTFIKGIILDGEGKVVALSDVPTRTGGELADCCEELAVRLVQNAGKVFSDITAVGVGCPGTITGDGTVLFAGNLGLKDYPLAKLLNEKLSLPVKVANDARTAALGEARFGAGKGYRSSVLVTLGTGVGGGIIIDGKLFGGHLGAGAEIGHMVIERNGERCTCGRRGCFETYASARALTKRVRAAMEEDTSSEMWKTYNLETADGRTAFEYMDTDYTAGKVIKQYLEYLAGGIINLCNIFRPEVVMIGGGVAAQGTRLTEPLQKLVDKEIFGGTSYAPVKVICATLGSKAGAYGAAALNMPE